MSKKRIKEVFEMFFWDKKQDEIRIQKYLFYNVSKNFNRALYCSGASLAA